MHEPKKIPAGVLEYAACSHGSMREAFNAALRNFDQINTNDCGSWYAAVVAAHTYIAGYLGHLSGEFNECMQVHFGELTKLSEDEDKALRQAILEIIEAKERPH